MTTPHSACLHGFGGCPIWFDRPYDKGAADATLRGWPTAHLAGNHLYMLTDPHTVAAAVMEMASNWL
ncbi:MAG TPA: hypothetical protein VIJ96_06310 [Acidothermaceae bacterium]